MSPISFLAYCLCDGLLFYNGHLVIPSDFFLCQQLLLKFHASPIGWHAGIARTYHHLASNFYWKGMKHDVKTFVFACQIFQQVKVLNHYPSGLL